MVEDRDLRLFCLLNIPSASNCTWHIVGIQEKLLNEPNVEGMLSAMPDPVLSAERTTKNPRPDETHCNALKTPRPVFQSSLLPPTSFEIWGKLLNPSKFCFSMSRHEN